MFNIQRKDMPLKGLLTTYEIRIDDPIMDKEIKKVIDKQGDRQNHKTNVKAQMTEWKMWHEPSFKKIADIALNVASTLGPKLYNRNINSNFVLKIIDREAQFLIPAFLCILIFIVINIICKKHTTIASTTNYV